MSSTYKVIDLIKENCNLRDLTPYRMRGLNSKGFFIGDAVLYGASSWLIEVEGSEAAWKHTDEIYQTLVDEYYPKCLAIMISMCQSLQSIQTGLKAT